jgi:hypothetical protein
MSNTASAVGRSMTCGERLEAVFQRRRPDRTPILGGWIACPEHIASLAGVDMETYWADPRNVSIAAYRALGSDGLIDVFVPKHRTDFRCVDHETYQHAASPRTLDEVLAWIDSLPEPREIERAFDFDTEYAKLAEELRRGRAASGEMLWMPAQWMIAARVNWYGELGYEHFFTVVGLHHERAVKLMRVGGAYGLCRSRLIARAVDDGLYPHAMLFGEDICTQRGPMISPAFMEEYYAPELERGLAPLLDSGCMPVWHSDGDIRPIMDMLVSCGVQGFQGFQPECGMRIEEIVERRTRDGKGLIIFGPLSVTLELPSMTPDEVKRRVREVIALCDRKAHLVLFTANTINPDVPLANIRAMHEAAHGE